MSPVESLLTPTLAAEADAEARTLYLNYTKPLEMEPTRMGVGFVLVKEWCANIMLAEVVVEKAVYENAVGGVPVAATDYPYGIRAKEYAAHQLLREATEERAKDQSRRRTRALASDERADPLGL